MACKYCEGRHPSADCTIGLIESQAEQQDKRVYAAWRIEGHPDKEMTFLGVFTSEELAQAACDTHCATKPYHKDWEYSIREGVLDAEGTWV